MKLGQLPLGIRQRGDDMSLSSILGASLRSPASPRTSIADVQKDPLDLA